MATAFSAGIVMAVLLLQSAAVVMCSFPTQLRLERIIPAAHKMDMNVLKERDRVRHSRMLRQQQKQSSSSSGGVGVVDFQVEGTFDPLKVGLYYARIQLGSPPRDFYVQIDTGSDVLWVSCSPCNGCPVTSGLNIQLNFFDPGSSSTASLVSCSDQRCSLGIQQSDSTCSAQSNQCSYTFQYGDGSGASGYYVSDLLHFDTILTGYVTSNSSASIAFGCSTVVTGDLTKSDRAIDGIFGFGPQDMSVVSQLASQGITPKVFSHCLKGDDTGGGILVLGEIVEPNIVYTPLVPSQPHFNLNLQSISVSGQTLAIDPSVFATSTNQGTIVDSGTTLAYLAEAAYDPFVTAIMNAVSQSVRPVVSKGNQCYLVTTSINDIFPQVSLNFASGASMILDPQHYLVQQNSVGGAAAVWCVGIGKIQGQALTILGDLVLKDKIIVYDMSNERMGWTDYDCSLSVNVSTTTNTGKSEFVNAGEMSDSSSSQIMPYKLIPMAIITLLIHRFVHGSYLVL